MVQLPEEEHLSTPEPVEKKSHEVTISKEVDKGRKAKEEEKKALADDSQNQTTQSKSDSLGPTHGAVAIFTPTPVIPDYLRDQDLKSSVVVEFFVTAQGAVTPRLLSSSGNDELDAIALAAVKKWQFRPAENEHKPIDAKFRLRIDFDVH